MSSAGGGGGGGGSGATVGWGSTVGGGSLAARGPYNLNDEEGWRWGYGGVDVGAEWGV